MPFQTGLAPIRRIVASVFTTFSRLALFILLASLGGVGWGCVAPHAPPALRVVTEQNQATIDAWSDNTRRLAAALTQAARARADLEVQRARESVAADLIAHAGPSRDAGSALTERAALLARRLATLPMEARSQAADELALEAPATIDLAMAEPGFTPARLLADAAELDRLNVAIDAEPVPTLRAGLHRARDTLLDAYRPPRRTLARTSAALGRLDVFISTTLDQSRTARTHAAALSAWTAPDPDPERTLESREHLRQTLLELVVETLGPDARQRADQTLTGINDLLRALPERATSNALNGGAR